MRPVVAVAGVDQRAQRRRHRLHLGDARFEIGEMDLAIRRTSRLGRSSSRHNARSPAISSIEKPSLRARRTKRSSWTSPSA